MVTGHGPPTAVLPPVFTDSSSSSWSLEDLSHLMRALGHPEDEVELNYLMVEWDVSGDGALDFDAFLSMISAFLKKEELDEQVPRVGTASRRPRRTVTPPTHTTPHHTTPHHTTPHHTTPDHTTPHQTTFAHFAKSHHTA